MSKVKKRDLAESLHAMLNYYDRETCVHEETRRLGTIWTQCTMCYREWADDLGGFVPYKEPEFVTRARDLLGTYES